VSTDFYLTTFDSALAPGPKKAGKDWFISGPMRRAHSAKTHWQKMPATRCIASRSSHRRYQPFVLSPGPTALVQQVMAQGTSVYVLVNNRDEDCSPLPIQALVAGFQQGAENLFWHSRTSMACMFGTPKDSEARQVGLTGLSGWLGSAGCSVLSD